MPRACNQAARGFRGLHLWQAWKKVLKIYRVLPTVFLGVPAILSMPLPAPTTTHTIVHFLGEFSQGLGVRGGGVRLHKDV